MFVSKKRYRDLERYNDELLNIIIDKNEEIEDKEKDIELSKTEIKTLKNEADKKDMHIRGLEDSNKLHIDKINDLEKKIEDVNRNKREIVKSLDKVNTNLIQEKNAFKKKYEEELEKRKQAEANLSKAIARNMVDDMTIKELEHNNDKLETIIIALKSEIDLSQEMKRQILDFLSVKDNKGNMKMEKGRILVHEAVSGEYVWNLARFI